jgi:hypothetical protein
MREATTAIACCAPPLITGSSVLHQHEFRSIMQKQSKD